MGNEYVKDLLSKGRGVHRDPQKKKKFVTSQLKNATYMRVSTYMFFLVIGHNAYTM